MDHCHLTGLYRGPADYSCNLKLTYQGRQANDSDIEFDGYMTPVVFHNLRGYDGHLLLKGYLRPIFKKKSNASQPIWKDTCHLTSKI